MIEIHVNDENKKIQKTFKCEKKLLFQQMKYFEAHARESYTDDLEISVHCDVAIFEWLMRYVKNKREPLTVKNVISILISSNYLKMANLEFDCIKFISSNLDQIVKLQIDLSCLTPRMIRLIVQNSTVEAIDAMQDKKDKLQGRLFTELL